MHVYIDGITWTSCRRKALSHHICFTDRCWLCLSRKTSEIYKVVRLKEAKISQGVHIDGHRKGTKLFLVEWENGPDGETYDDSWEPAKNLEQSLLDDFGIPMIA